MRTLDDKIVYTLNVHLPTESFRAENDSRKTCKELFEQLQSNHKSREEAIRRCMKFSSDIVQDLKSKKETQNDVNILKALRKEQTKVFHQFLNFIKVNNFLIILFSFQLRLLQTELGVEEVVREKSTKVYYERCRPFYVPPNLNV